jgi:hypothetical protein
MTDQPPDPKTPPPIRLVSSTDTPGQAPRFVIDPTASGPLTLRRIARPTPTPVPPRRDGD